MDNYIYSNNYYQEYENLDSVIQMFQNLNIQNKKTIVWKLFQIKTTSKINWNSNIINCRHNIQYIMLNLIHYLDWNYISYVSEDYHPTKINNYNLMEGELIEELEKWKNIHSKIVIAPILPLRNLNIMGIFILGNNNLNLHSDTNKYKNTVQYNLLSDLSLYYKNNSNKVNIIKAMIVSSNNDNDISFNIKDDNQNMQVITLKRNVFLNRIANYFPILQILHH